jgi:hypothetical protein
VSVTASFGSCRQFSSRRLQAQGGVFTWLHGEKAHERTVDEHLQALFARSPEGYLGVRPPLMYRASLDRSQAPRLLRLLADEGVTGATVFPGYEGVVKAMREEGWWRANKGWTHKH